MNERIRLLAEQAGFEITPWGNELLPCVHQEGPIDVELNKFAELIVRECLYIVEGEDDCGPDTISVRLAMIRMKQHFGVEE